MSRQKLILIPSEKMDTNKKSDRNENGLIRMSKVARDFMKFDKNVEIYPDTKSVDTRLNNSILLDIYQAFSDDIKAARAAGVAEGELCRVGFVTTKTFNRVSGKRDKTRHNVWITDDVNDTVIGADPEFVLFDEEGNVVRANNVLSHEGLIGSDGAMAEIRPKPAISPEDLTENIRSIFSNDKLVNAIKKYKWIGGCYFQDRARDYPVGGHIHIGNPIKIARMDTEDRVNFFKAFNKIMDELLAIPMIKIDGTDAGRARRTQCKMGKYGYFGEFRTCNGRLEHRTLSGMWLTHPELTTCVFGTAKAIIDEVYRHVANSNYNKEYMFPAKFKNASIWQPGFDGWKTIPLIRDLGCVLDSSEMVEYLHESAVSKITTKFLAGWYERMRGLSTYNLYSTHIDNLYSILKNNQKTLNNCNKDIQKAWLEGGEFLG